MAGEGDVRRINSVGSDDRPDHIHQAVVHIRPALQALGQLGNQYVGGKRPKLSGLQVLGEPTGFRNEIQVVSLPAAAK